nr:hypothetical protein [PVC group bacterium]
GDGLIGISDLLLIIANWGSCSHCISDLDHDNEVGVNDILTLLTVW